jgi:hypothetical protein
MESAFDRLYNRTLTNMYDSFKPDKFRHHETDTHAIRWYFKHVFASKQMSTMFGTQKYNLYMTAFRDEKKLANEQEFTVECWKEFATYFAEKVELGQYKDRIAADIESILRFRHGAEESPLEQTVETTGAPVPKKEHAPAIKTGGREYIPLAFMGITS